MENSLSQIFWTYGVFIIALALIGVYCLLFTLNLIRILIGLEIITKAVTLFIILAGKISGNVALAQTFVITMIIIEVVIMIIGGGIIISVFKEHGTVDVRVLRKLKG